MKNASETLTISQLEARYALLQIALYTCYPFLLLIITEPSPQ